MTSIYQKPQLSALNAEDERLLSAMLGDMQKQKPEYRPGPYWESKTIMSAQSIYQHGYDNFRSAKSNIGLSYADNPVVYYESLMSRKRKQLHGFFKKFFLTRDFIDWQVRMTENQFREVMRHQQYLANISPDVLSLLDKYDLSRSCSFGCDWSVEIKGKTYPILYVELCQQIDQIAKRVNLNEVTSVFEIGGGFGAMAHILLQNFPNIKTYIYLDIPPNLFIGTQYLKSLFPGRVHDYLALRDLDVIRPQQRRAGGDGPDIFCICPWQIERLDYTADLFYNSHSFVEMNESIVSNYAAHIKKLSKPTTQYAFVTYDNGTDTSLAPNRLPGFFPFADFEKFERLKVFEPWRHNFYLVGKNADR